jgi:hypothetical protein
VTTLVAFAGRTTTPARRSVVAGILGAAGLLGLYLGVISIAQGPAHAVEQLAADALFVLPITIAFGVQLGLFTELHALHRRHRAGAAVTAAAAGTSTAAMLACCAHHVVDLLPLFGLSAAAVFLNEFKTPLLVLGLGLNAVAIGVIARELRRARRACSAVGAGA